MTEKKRWIGSWLVDKTEGMTQKLVHGPVHVWAHSEAEAVGLIIANIGKNYPTTAGWSVPHVDVVLLPESPASEMERAIVGALDKAVAH